MKKLIDFIINIVLMLILMLTVLYLTFGVVIFVYLLYFFTINKVL